jgi:TBC1 domain family member 2
MTGVGIGRASAPPDGDPILRDPKVAKFTTLLSAEVLDVTKLKELVWSGCPSSTPMIRGIAWKVLIGYYPARLDRRSEVRSRKQLEYASFKQGLPAFDAGRSDPTKRQIELDIPRTCFNKYAALTHPVVCQIMREVLLVWALRNPACGYVQGMNDLLVPLLVVLLQAITDEDIGQIAPEAITSDTLFEIECDLYWMFSKLLQELVDNFTPSQPGIQKQNTRLRDILRRVDNELLTHLTCEHVNTLQLCFRWFNCLMVREFDIQSVLRIWDTCFSEGRHGFSSFLVYIAAALILRNSQTIKTMDLQGILSFFGQDFRENHLMDSKGLESLLSEAYVLQSLFHDSPHHLRST